MPSQLPHIYQVGVICALPKEMLAAKTMLDEEHDPPKMRDPQDPNNYVPGRVHGHNVVIACLPAGQYGTNAAAMVAGNMLRTFPGIRFGLMVGIGGGVPGHANHNSLRLGDVVVSQPQGTFGGVLQYDLGKNLGEGKFERKGSLNSPPGILLTALSSIQAQPGSTRRRLAQIASAMIQRVAKEEDEDYSFPGLDQDQLFCARCDRSEWSVWRWLLWCLLFWLMPLWLCDICEKGRIRRPLHRANAEVHYGTIASGNALIKNRLARDRLYNMSEAICVEMEAAGLMNDFPCLVIRGICDYADSHKNDIWQKYAAITAAAFAKIVLLTVSPIEVQSTGYAAAVMENSEINGSRTHELLAEGLKLHQQGIHEQSNQSRVIEGQYLADQERQCLQGFKKEGSYEEYKNVNPPKIPGTCRWVIEHPLYKTWHHSVKNELLWISADPGCGKSVLSRALVDDFVDIGQGSICYFFFKDNPSQDNLSTALCAILHQLFHSQPLLLKHALPSWSKNGRKLQQENGEMWRILLAAAADPSAKPILCVFDALDECGDSDRRQLIGNLCDFFSLPGTLLGPPLKVLVTSRPYDSVQRWFENITSRFPQIRLRGEDENEQINQEINLVIDQRVDDLTTEFNLSRQSQEKLRERLKKMEHRTYLWLYLAYEDIRDAYQVSLSDDNIHIESLPKSVDEAYDRILNRISAKHKTLARRVLTIIVGAQRPLDIEEMALALSAAQAHEYDQTHMDVIDHKRLKKQIRELCGLFVFYHNSHLYLIHQTAKEFLIANDSASAPLTQTWKFSFHEADIEAEMARICVTYLCLADFDTLNIDSIQEWIVHDDGSSNNSNIEAMASHRTNATKAQHNFFRYCAIRWLIYLHDDALADDSKLRVKARSLCNTKTRLFGIWFPLRFRAVWRTSFVPTVQDHHVACMTSCPMILRDVLNTPGLELSAQDSGGDTALTWAVRGGNGQMIQTLLDGKINIDAECGYNGSPLYVATMSGYDTTVEMLLSAGANPDYGGKAFYGFPLQAAARNGNEIIVSMLLRAGANVNMRGGNHHSAMEAALRRDHENIVRMLRDAGAVEIEEEVDGDDDDNEEDDDDDQTKWEIESEGALTFEECMETRTVRRKSV